jgi:phage-related protein
LAQVNLLVNFAVDNSIEMANREIRFYKHYFNEFYTAQTEQTRKKIAQTLVWLREVDRLPVSILKSIEGRKGLYEIRIECGSNIFRIFCCFDKGNLVILFNGFQKKTQKTPSKELDKAEKLMNEYFKEK